MKVSSREQLRKELSEVPGSASQLESLLGVAAALEALPQPARSKTAATTGLRMLENRIKNEQNDGKRNWKIFLVIPVAMAALGLIVLISQNSLPGDPTYAIKRLGENVQFAVALSPASKADQCSWQMKRRANELARLGSTASTATTKELTSDIIEEATEFEALANQTGTNKEQLYVQRKRDAEYVIDALTGPVAIQRETYSQQALASTIAAMRKIANS